MAILKTTADTNAGQSHRLTHFIKSLHCYDLKSLIFKHSLLFMHTFINTTTFEDLFFCEPIAHKCYMSSSSLFLLVETRVHSCEQLQRPKKKLKPDTSGSIFPTTPRQKSNPHPREGLTNQFPHSQAQNIFKCPGFAWGDVEVSI